MHIYPAIAARYHHLQLTKGACFLDWFCALSKLLLNKKESNFKKFKVEHSTVIWSDELDLAAEYLFYLAFKDDRNLQEQFKLWGMLPDKAPHGR